MGGRFDATNVVRPLVSVITTIAKDHEKHLGSTLEKIAFEKAGIIKPGVPVVCGVRGGGGPPGDPPGRPRARERLSSRSSARGGRSRPRPRAAASGSSIGASAAATSFRPALAGRHQGANAAVAIATAEVLSRTWKPLDKARIVKAVRETRWEGRLETVRRRPLVLLDGAHNVEGAEALAAHIRETVRRPVVLVFAAMQDKDIRSMTRLLFPVCDDGRPDPRPLQAVGHAGRARRRRPALQGPRPPRDRTRARPSAWPWRSRGAARPSSSPARSSSSARSSASGCLDEIGSRIRRA